MKRGRSARIVQPFRAIMRSGLPSKNGRNGAWRMFIVWDLRAYWVQASRATSALIHSSTTSCAALGFRAEGRTR